MKPVASGCHVVDGALRNDDALRRRRAGSYDVPYDRVNPYAFEPPIAPNIAAEEAGRGIELSLIRERLHLLRRDNDWVVVEGVGGWEVSLNERERVSHLAVLLGLPVILVVGLRLGCLNHAIFSERWILASGVDYRGWCVNKLSEDFPHAEGNVRTLRASLSGDFPGTVPYHSRGVDFFAEPGSSAELSV